MSKPAAFAWEARLASDLISMAEVHSRSSTTWVRFEAAPRDDGIAVFDVNLADLSNQNFNYQLNLNGATSVLMNVTGDTGLTQFGNFQGTFRNSASQILWNFNSTQGNFNLVDREWYGSLLMPHAGLTNYSPINGGVYVGGDFHQRADVRQVGYSGPPILDPARLPEPEDGPAVASVPEPATIAVLAVGGLIIAGCQWHKRRRSDGVRPA